MRSGGRRTARAHRSTHYRAGVLATLLPGSALAVFLSLLFAWPDPAGLQLAAMILSLGLVPLGAIAGTAIAAGRSDPTRTSLVVGALAAVGAVEMTFVLLCVCH